MTALLPRNIPKKIPVPDFSYTHKCNFHKPFLRIHKSIEYAGNYVITHLSLIKINDNKRSHRRSAEAFLILKKLLNDLLLHITHTVKMLTPYGTAVKIQLKGFFSKSRFGVNILNTHLSFFS